MDTCGNCPEIKRKPLRLLTGIFSRRKASKKETRGYPITSDDKINYFNRSDEDDSEEGDLLLIPEPKEALHSPYHAKTIDQDMENLRLSRQDNPYLQVLASRECLYDSTESLFEEKHLMTKENTNRQNQVLTLEEVHARLVRSPPPVMWTRNRNSEPSFIHLIDSNGKVDSVFQFPHRNLEIPSGYSSTDQMRIRSPSQYSESNTHVGRQGRFVENALEALTARFNLSPQPRKRNH